MGGWIMRKEYFVSIGSVDNTDNKCEKDTDACTNDDSAEACYDIVKVEYLHAFSRSDKLDNKVYIALTFCAFIFIFVLGLINPSITFKYPTDIYQLLLIVIYIVVSSGTIGMFLYTLVQLATLLKAMQVRCVDTNFIVENNLQKQNPYTIYTFVATKYVETINKNNIILEDRFKKYNNCITKIVWIVIVAFILNMLKIFIKTK